jgi:hypothetical protein
VAVVAATSLVVLVARAAVVVSPASLEGVAGLPGAEGLLRPALPSWHIGANVWTVTLQRKIRCQDCYRGEWNCL